MNEITLETEVTFVAIECGGCGVSFALTERFDRARREDHKIFYCPNGCRRAYNAKSKAEKLEHDLLVERAKLDQAKADAQYQKKRAEGIQGELTKTKKRVSGGACPCCNRSFVNLARHMAGQHPDYVEAKKS